MILNTSSLGCRQLIRGTLPHLRDTVSTGSLPGSGPTYMASTPQLRRVWVEAIPPCILIFAAEQTASWRLSTSMNRHHAQGRLLSSG